MHDRQLRSRGAVLAAQPPRLEVIPHRRHRTRGGDRGNVQPVQRAEPRRFKLGGRDGIQRAPIHGNDHEQDAESGFPATADLRRRLSAAGTARGTGRTQVYVLTRSGRPK